MDAAGAIAEPVYTERATAVAHAWVRKPVHDELVYEAERRRMHPDALAALLLTSALVLGRVDELIEEAQISLQS